MLGISLFFASVHMCVFYSSACEIRDVWSVVQPHVDLGELIGSSETEEPVVAMTDVGPTPEEVQVPLAMWEAGIQHIELEKGSRGLGFSILDYQDPVDPASTVIVIRSLVPGGIAEKDGRLLPGDRLMFVNDINLENSSLEEAVEALKGAPSGTVRIGVTKPLPVRIWILLIYFYMYKKSGSQVFF
ncbi:multiple PDZ domain protein-like [Marmota monax]|uniref:multiple PDZ domain protein-like n=1 Tax=Marmota monax TaxID=9995 RepID=UPI0026EE1C39|nr:multiple PDZ domain protein-like [Marmota monax]